MKQLLHSVSRGKAVVAEVPAPRPGPGELLVAVRASLISAGTERSTIDFAQKNLFQKAFARPDLVSQVLDKARREGIYSAIETVRNRLNADLVLGYSNSGIILEVGTEVSGFSPGDRVACAGGGYANHAEIVRVPQNLAASIPAHCARGREISFEEAAFATIGAVALHGVRLAQPELAGTMGMIGLGTVGLLAAQLAQAAGCRVIGEDPSEDRCHLAAKLGCDAVSQTPSEMCAIVKQQTCGIGCDAVLITAATQDSGPVELAGEIARERARIVVVGAVGLEIPRKLYYEKELALLVSRSYGPGRYDPEYEQKGRDYPVAYVRWTENRNIAAFLQFLADRRITVEPLVTHRYHIADAERAYELISGKTGEPSLGVLITYPDTIKLERRIELAKSKTHAAGTVATIGFLGPGNFARSVLLPAMKAAKGIEFIGIAGASGVNARSAGAKFGFKYCASDEEELLRDPAINTIAIATRHSLHARQTIAALSAGKHVFCEKPLCLTESELNDVLSAYQSACDVGVGPLLMVGYNRRSAPLAVELKRFFDKGREPLVIQYRVNAGYLPPTHWTHDPNEGGRIIGEVCHFVDFAIFLAGCEVSSVYAKALPNRGRYRDDNVLILLGFDDGSAATITYVANGDRAAGKERIEAFGGGCVGVLDDFRTLQLVRDGKRSTVRSYLHQDKGHRGEWSAFTASLRQGVGSPIPLRELVNTSRTTFAIAESLHSGASVAVPSFSNVTGTGKI